MSYVKYILVMFIIWTQLNNAQNIIFGKIYNDKALKDVNISLSEINNFTVSDRLGKYKLENIPDGEYHLAFSHIGYKNKTIKVELKNNVRYELNVLLDKILIQLGEAQVVASRSRDKIKNLSMPIEYFNELKFDNSFNLTIPDILKRESGIAVIKDGPWATAINIRGLSKQNIVYLIDGSRIETSANIAAGLSLMDINDIENIEVVKSGLSSLYGTGATGGVINIQSKKADFSSNSYFSSQIISGISSVNNNHSNYMNLRMGDKNWSLKLSGSIRRADDTELPDGSLKNSSFKDEGFGGMFNIAPHNNAIINISYQKFNAFDVGIPGGAPFPKSAIAKYKYANRELLSASLDCHNVSDIIFKTSLKYYFQLISRKVEIKPNPLVTSKPSADHTTQGIIFQSDWLLNQDNFFIIGIDFWQREYDGLRKVTNIANNVINVDKPVPNSKFSSIGIFAKNEFAFSDDVRLSVSARYDFINISNEETKNPLYIISGGVRNDNIKNDLASYEAHEVNNSSASGGFGVVYKLTNQYDFTFNMGYNFRSPSLEERYQFIDLGGIIYLGNTRLNPEEGFLIDAGFRIWKNNINFRMNTFINTFSNLVMDDVLYQDSIYIKNNVGRARLYGFDANLDYNFYRNFILYVNASYVRGEDLTQNADLPQIAPFNGTAGMVIQLFDLFKINLSANFAANQNNTAIGEKKTSGYAYFDVSVILKPLKFGFMNIKLISGIENIFNRKYREHLSTYRGIDRLEPGRNIYAKCILDIN